MMKRIRIENDDDDDDDDGTLTTSFVFDFLVGCSAGSKFASMDVIVEKIEWYLQNGICIQEHPLVEEKFQNMNSNFEKERLFKICFDRCDRENEIEW